MSGREGPQKEEASVVALPAVLLCPSCGYAMRQVTLEPGAEEVVLTCSGFYMKHKPLNVRIPVSGFRVPCSIEPAD